jgi:hypothetical protein
MKVASGWSSNLVNDQAPLAVVQAGLLPAVTPSLNRNWIPPIFRSTGKRPGSTPYANRTWQ